LLEIARIVMYKVLALGTALYSESCIVDELSLLTRLRGVFLNSQVPNCPPKKRILTET